MRGATIATPSWWKTSGDGLELTLVVRFGRRLLRRRFLLISQGGSELGMLLDILSRRNPANAR